MSIVKKDFATRTYGERVEHLLGSLSPDLRVLDALWSTPRLWHKELSDAVHGTIQGETVGSDCYEKDIGEGCCEVDNLARSNGKQMCFIHFLAHLAAGFDPLDQTSEANNPGEEEAEGDVPLDLANIAGVGERIREV